MKRYLNNHDYFKKELNPESTDKAVSSNRTAALNMYQKDFLKYISAELKLHEEGEVTHNELQMIQKVKTEIKKLKEKNRNISPQNLDFELGKIFHDNLKIDRQLINDWNFWRWLSLNYFLEKIQWRWAKEERAKTNMDKAAKNIFDHLIGKNKNHRIFPRRLWIIGLRLHDKMNGYNLLDKISQNLKTRQGGFGDYINNIVDDKLVSHNDYVSKILGELLLAETKVQSKSVVVRSFKKYNGYKNRLISEAGRELFEKEICQL
ncbi:MAG TPA: DUF6339 family protein [Bacteroidia bacterium]|nr:DUF6339 family protein [Bacteroidia bacterium]